MKLFSAGLKSGSASGNFDESIGALLFSKGLGLGTLSGTNHIPPFWPEGISKREGGIYSICVEERER